MEKTFFKKKKALNMIGKREEKKKPQVNLLNK